MIKTDLHKLFLEKESKKDSELNYKDATILNVALYDLLTSNYMSPDFSEMLPMYHQEENYIWIKRNSKFIPGKSGNNLVLGEDIDVAGMNYNTNWKKISESSSPLLPESEVKKWKNFEESFSTETIEDLGVEKIKNYLKIHDNETFKDLYEMLKESPSSKKLGKISDRYGLDIDMEEDEIFVALLSDFKNEFGPSIKEFSNAKTLESVAPEKSVSKFKDYLSKKIPYVKSLDEKPSQKEVQYKVFEINSEDDHRAYNKWVSSLDPVKMTNSVWVNYGQKGLFYLTPISQQDGFSKKFMIIAHNDIEVVGMTQVNDMLSNVRLSDRDEDAYKMPHIGIQQKYRGQGIASKMFEKVLDIIERDQKFLLRTAPSEMGGRYTQEKFTKMGQTLKHGILVNSDESVLYESFKKEVKDLPLDYTMKRDMYDILKQEMTNRLIEDKHFCPSDAHELMSSPKVIKRFSDEVFNKKSEVSATRSKALKA